MTMVWVALATETIVVLAAAVAGIRWVNKPASKTPARSVEQGPAGEPSGALVEQPA